MPEPGNAPPELQDLLDKVYKSARKEPGYDKGAASATAWKAAKSAGWYKKAGQWTRKNETESSWYKWNGFWKQAEHATPDPRESVVTALGTVKVQESLVPFRARILLAVPGKSLNNRIYPKETLQQAASLYKGRPFILDHNIEDANKVIGMFWDAEYTTERSPYTNQDHEGLWADARGLIEQDLFDKIKGTPLVPPLVRNVSIGGQGDGDYNVDGGTLIKNFIPAEGSITAFPGIPEAHIAQFTSLREHYLGHGDVKNTSMNDVRASLETRYGIRKKNPNEKEKPPVGGKNVFHETPPADKLMEIRERETREGPWMPSIPPNRPDLRGATAEPDSQQYKYDWTIPQATTSRDAGYMPDPSQNTGDWNAGRQDNIGSVQGFDPASKNQTYGPTKYTRFMKGYSSTEDAPGTAGSPGSKDAKAWTDRQKTPPLGRTTTKTAGFGRINRGKMGPGASGIPEQDDESRERAYKQALINSLNRDLSRVLQKMRYGTSKEEQMPLKPGLKLPRKSGEEEEEEEAKVDISGPEEDEEEEAVMTTQKPGEEEEEEEEERIMRKLVRIEQRAIARELQADLGDQTNPWPNIGRSSMPTNYSRTYYNGPGINATHMPPNEYDPRPVYSAGRKKAAYARASEKKGEEEEEEEEERQQLVNRLLRIRMRRLAMEAVPGAEPRANAPIPKTPKLGNTTTKTKGFGTQSPSGTGITDQDEEEENYRREQSRSDVDKTDRPEGEEEEEERATVTISDDEPAKIADEEESRMPSDLLRKPEDFVQANPIRSGGEEEERRVIIPDLTPDDYHAPAMPYGTGIEKLWNQIHPDPRMDQQKVGEMVELWRRFKTPQAEKPPSVYVQLPKEQKKQRMKETQGSPTLSSEMNTVPWLGVQAKGMAPIYPTYTGPATSSGTRSVMDEAKGVIESISKEPMAPGRMTTAMAHEAYIRMLSQGRILGIRR